MVSRGRPSLLSFLPYQPPDSLSQCRGNSPSIRFPMQPVVTMGIHGWLWGRQKAGTPQHHRHQRPAYDIGPNGPNRTWPAKHRGAWQPGEMSVRTEGMGCPPGSRCSYSISNSSRSSGSSLEQCLCGETRTDGSPELDVSMVQP